MTCTDWLFTKFADYTLLLIGSILVIRSNYIEIKITFGITIVVDGHCNDSYQKLREIL